MSVHDHFDGSAHCVECQGYCTLTGSDLHLTRVIRFALEQLAYAGYRPNQLLRESLEAAGVNDVEHFVARAETATSLSA